MVIAVTSVDAPDVLHWLMRYDSRPTLLPEWPLPNSGMALVMVRGSGEVLVVLSSEELREISSPSHGLARLFFRVPKIILVQSGIVPNLRLTSWID